MASSRRRSGALTESKPASSVRPRPSIKGIRQIQQQQILERLFDSFPPQHGLEQQHPNGSTATSTKSTQPGLLKAVQIIQKDTWSPSDRWQVDTYIDGLAKRHAIQLSYELSTALNRCYNQLKTSAERAAELSLQARQVEQLRSQERGTKTQTIDDPLIIPENVADMVQFLIHLSKPADVTTKTAAHLLLDPQRPKAATYLDSKQRQAAERSEWYRILLNDPLQGEEWIPNESDEASLSSWSSVSDQEEDNKSQDSRDFSRQEKTSTKTKDPATNTHLGFTFVDNVESRQIRAHTLQQVGNQGYWLNFTQADTAMSEIDALREGLHALMGDFGGMFIQPKPDQVHVRKGDNGQDIVSDVTMSHHLQHLAHSSTLLQQLRNFVKAVEIHRLDSSRASEKDACLEAFAEQVQLFLERLSKWCSEYDSDLAAVLTRAHPSLYKNDRVATLNQLVVEVEHQAATLLLLHTMLAQLGLLPTVDVWQSRDKIRLARRALIDSLYNLLVFCESDSVLKAAQVQNDLAQCFLVSADPVWKLICHHVQFGVKFDLAPQSVQQEQAQRLLEKDNHDHHVDHCGEEDDLVERNSQIHPLETRFWREGYHVRKIASVLDPNDTASIELLPSFLLPLVDQVLVTSKSVGLLRAFGIDAIGALRPCDTLKGVLIESQQMADDHHSANSSVQADEDLIERPVSTNDPPNSNPPRLSPIEARNKIRNSLFQHTRSLVKGRLQLDPAGTTGSSISTSVSNVSDSFLQEDRAEILEHQDPLVQGLLQPRLSQSLQQHLEPIFTVVRKRLYQVLSNSWLDGGCNLFAHLDAIHGLYLMRKGAEMAAWCKSIFDKLESVDEWHMALEFHHLNSSFRDLVESSSRSEGCVKQAWVDTSLVRFYSNSSTTGRHKSQVDRLADIRVEYQVPWPVSYCFPSICMQTYQEVFSLLIQARWARKKLADAFTAGGRQLLDNSRKFWALRRKAEWLVRILDEYIQRDVLETFVSELEADLEGLVTIDSLIEYHSRWVRKIQSLCFLRSDQKSVNGLIQQVWQLAVDIVKNYEGVFGKPVDHYEREKRKLRRQKRRQKRKENRKRQPCLPEISEDDEEEEEEDGVEQDEKEHLKPLSHSERDGDSMGGIVQRIGGIELKTSFLTNSSFSLSSSFDQSFASWTSDAGQRNVEFRDRLDRQSQQLEKLVRQIKVGVDEQMGKLAVDTALETRTKGMADELIREQHSIRERYQDLLYCLADWR